MLNRPSTSFRPVAGVLVDDRRVHAQRVAARADHHVFAVERDGIGPADVDPDGAGTGARPENEIELDGVLAAVEDQIGGRIDVSVRHTPEGRNVTPPLLRIVGVEVVDLARQLILGFHAGGPGPAGQAQADHVAPAPRRGPRQPNFRVRQLQPRAGAQAHVPDIGAGLAHVGHEGQRELRDLRADRRGTGRRARSGCRSSRLRPAGLGGTTRKGEGEEQQRTGGDTSAKSVHSQPPRVALGPHG